MLGPSMNLFGADVPHTAQKQTRSPDAGRRPAPRVPLTVSDKGAVSIRASDALKDRTVRAQLAVVGRIRTGNTPAK